MRFIPPPSSEQLQAALLGLGLSCYYPLHLILHVQMFCLLFSSVRLCDNGKPLLNMYFCKRFTSPALKLPLLRAVTAAACQAGVPWRSQGVVLEDEGAAEFFAPTCPSYPLQNKVWTET